jgi:SAM-dependent MidA family methyltransferase
MVKNLRDCIQSEGPIPLAEVMALSNDYYYNHRIVFGASGDFITAPEISQIFGELVGLWVLLQAQHLSTQTPSLIELGPGRGTLMADMIRVFQKKKGFTPSLHLVETSQRLREIQQHTLHDSPYSVTWHTDFPKAITGPTLIIANEFFDALPIQQYVYKEGQWHEVCVDCDDHRFFYAYRPCPDSKDLPKIAKEGDVFESSKISNDYAKTLSMHLKKNTGAALMIDYGDRMAEKKTRFGDTFQALRHHHFVHPLAHLGEADVTAHVDFRRLLHIFQEDGHACTLTTQCHFLKAHGFDLRLQALLASCADDAQKNDMLSRAHRLTHPSAMGTLFKVLEIV